MTITKTGTARNRRYSLGPLYDLVSERFPELRTPQGIFDVPTLASLLGLSAQTLYRSFTEDRLTVKVATRLIELSRTRGDSVLILRTELLDFLLPDDADAEV